MTAAHAARPGSGMRRWGMILAVLGGVILLLSIIAGAVMAFAGLGKVVAGSASGSAFTGSTTVTLSAGDEIHLYRRKG